MHWYVVMHLTARNASCESQLYKQEYNLPHLAFRFFVYKCTCTHFLRQNETNTTELTLRADSYPVNMTVHGSTGPVLSRCYQHRLSTGPVLAPNGMFTG